MANSEMNREEKARIRKEGRNMRNRLFLSAMDDVKKDFTKHENAKKDFLKQCKSESCSQNLNCSKKSSNELAADPIKQSKPCQEKVLPPNDKPYENPIKQFSNSRQSADQNEDTPDCCMRTSRNSKLHNSSNKSNEYLMNAGHGDNSEKFSGLPKSDFSYESHFLKSKDTFVPNSCMKTFTPNSSERSESINPYRKKFLRTNEYSENHVKSTLNSRKYVDQNDMQMSRNTRSFNSSNNSSNYHSTKPDYRNEKSYKLNSNSLTSNSHIHTSHMNTFKHSPSSREFNSSNTSPKKFDKDYSNFKRNCNFQKPYSSNNTRENSFHPSQHHDSYKSSLNRNHRRFDSNSDNIRPSYKLDRNIKMRDDIEKDSFLDENLNSVEDTNTEINHQRSFSELDDTITINRETMSNMKITFKSIPDSLPITSISSSSSIAYDSNASVSKTLSVSTVSSTPISPVLNISPVSVISNASPVFSPVSALESAPNLSLSNVFDDQNINNDSIKMLISSDDNFIPPPTSCESPGSSDKLHSSAEKNVTYPQKNGSESTEAGSYEDEAYFSLPDSKHLEAISKFILNIVKERSVSCSVAVTVVRDLNVLFKTNFEGNVIEYYGSYYTDLAITTSDINLVIKADVSIRKSLMYEIHKVLDKELENYHVLRYEEKSTTHKCKINFTHTSTGINCELAYLGSKPDKILNMGKFLKEMCKLDPRVRPLITATKIWAEHYNINEVEDGKLHPIGFTLLVIHFLQHCENPVLPVYSPEKKDMVVVPFFQDMDVLPRNDSCIGALWLGFLWYYSYVFNWQENILTVTSLDRVSKKSKKWENYWMAIEDPFTEKNIAESVINKDVADCIKTCFRQTYSYFLNVQESFPEDDSNKDQNSTPLLEFSFNDCVLEQNEYICEMCEEIDDVCDECKKKNYVQPMASVPKMTDDFLKVIRRSLLTVYKKYMLSDEEVDQRRQFVSKLEKYVHELYPDAKMNLFGSSANGFAFKKSDLDVNLTFESKKEHTDSVILTNLRRHLRRNPDFVDVIAIFSAQIPVLKFRYKPQGWRGDISLDNVLAIHNSELLYTYTLLDKSCKILGCALKLIAKKALIVETTEKALSSYSYAIMVIHFLQQTDPPVLPVLQDVQFRDNYELGHVVDNCNVWFCQDIDYIKTVFKAENDTPVEQLFLDLLDYYCSFDCNNVITIRQKELVPLASCEKMRSARLFNIQDPFLVDKNLGCVVSPTKAQETKSVFNRARMLFRTPKKELHTDNLEDYFFSTMGLTGRIQKEAFCDLCGKFGHDDKDCKQTFLPKNNFFKPFHRKNFFKPFPKKDQYTNRNESFRRNQNYYFKMNSQRFMEKL